jgi:hypothetical protein
MCGINALIFWRDYSQYHKIYEDLKNRKFYVDKQSEIICSSPLFADDMLIWMYKKDRFSLRKGLFLYKSGFHYLNSPYSLYWLWKFKKWFRDNCDLSELEEKHIEI